LSKTAKPFALPGHLEILLARCLGPNARRSWTIESSSHLEARTLYQYKGWGTYTTDFPDENNKTYGLKGWE